MNLHQSLKVFMLFFLPIISFAQIEEEVIEMEMAEPPPPSPQMKDNVPKVAPKHAYHGQQNGRYGFYTNSEWVIPPVYDELDKEYSDFMRANKGDKYGAIDRLNNEIIPFEYEKMFKVFKSYKNWKDREWTGLYSLEKNGLKGVVDKTGKIRIPVIYKDLWRIEENLFRAGSEELGFGLVTLDNEIVLPFDYESGVGLMDKEKMIFSTRKNGKIGWIDIKGKVILPFEYEELKSIGSPATHYSYKKDGKWGFMDANGKILVEPKYDYIKRKRNGIYIVTSNKKNGLVNSDFNEIAPPIYKRIEAISDLYFRVNVDGENYASNYGVIDTLGELIIDTLYKQHIRAGAGEIIFAQENHPNHRLSNYAVFDRNGKQILLPTYTSVKRIRDFYSVTKGFERDSKKALLNNKGEALTPYLYDKIDAKRKRGSKTSEYIIYAERDDMKGTLNQDGTENSDFQPMNTRKKQTDYATQQKKSDRLIHDQIRGEWYGISNQGYLVNVSFLSPESGIRTVYYLKEGEECAVEYYFVPKIVSGLNMIMTQVQFRDMTVKCDKPSVEFLAIKDKLLFNENLSYKAGSLGKGFRLKGYTKKESPATTADNYDILRKIKSFKQIEKELKGKVESKPGGLRNPSFEISPTTNELWVNSYSKYLFGKMVELDGEYVFEPNKWADTSLSYSLSGILRNVRYRDKNGKVKTGDLDIGFLATDSQPFYFKEINQ